MAVDPQVERGVASSVPSPTTVRSTHAHGPRNLEALVSVIPDEFSSMSDEDYAAALADWMAEVGSADPVVVPVSAADTLREMRELGES